MKKVKSIKHLQKKANKSIYKIQTQIQTKKVENYPKSNISEYGLKKVNKRKKNEDMK